MKYTVKRLLFLAVHTAVGGQGRTGLYSLYLFVFFGDLGMHV